jgi:hypothetical protein
VSLPFQQLAKEPFRRAGVTISLDQYVNHVPVLIYGPPQILLLAIDFHENLIDVERITITTMPTFESSSVSNTKLDAPESDGFVADSDASFCEQILNITVA